MRRVLPALIRGRRTVVLLLALGSLAVPAATPSLHETAARASDQQCALSLENGEVLASTGRVYGGQPVGFTLSGRARGDCAGRSFRLDLPPQLTPLHQSGSVLDSRGDQVGRVRTTLSGQVRVTMQQALHPSGFAAAFVARVRYTAPPNALLHLRWRSGATVLAITTVRTAPCGECRHPRSRASGRALLDGNNVDFTLASARSRERDEHVRFSVHLARTLWVRCGQVSARLGRNGLGRWGELRTAGRLRLHDLRCTRDHALLNRSGTVITGWVRLPRARRYAVISVRAHPRDPGPSRYPMWGRVGQRHDRRGVAVAARRYASLLTPSVDLVPRATETPSPTPSPSPRPKSTSASPSSSGDQRGPVVTTTVAILAAGVVVLMARIRRRSS